MKRTLSLLAILFFFYVSPSMATQLSGGPDAYQILTKYEIIPYVAPKGVNPKFAQVASLRVTVTLKNKTTSAVPLGQVIIGLSPTAVKNFLPVTDGINVASAQATAFGIINYANPQEEKIVFMGDFPIYSNTAGSLNLGGDYLNQIEVLAPDGPYQWNSGVSAALSKQEDVKLPSLSYARDFGYNLIDVDGKWVNNN
jgi:hypothetical protein